MTWRIVFCLTTACALVWLAATATAGDSQPKVVQMYPDLPRPVTSFGAAIVGQQLFLYGGHDGEPHNYYAEAQSGTLTQLDLQDGGQWKQLATGPGLQGLALVADADKLYRLGGFAATNKKGEKQNLVSTDEVAKFDPQKGEWAAMPRLPEPRSSFDAAVMDHKIYVVGGWHLKGAEETVWHQTAYVMDLSQGEPRWEPLPTPSFQRRALSLAAHEGKIYAIGGMTSKGPTTRVDVYDPATGRWSEAPALPGDGMDGFGSSAFATGGRLYASTINGEVLRLSTDRSAWESICTMERERFFHRMLPLEGNKLLFVGGASMAIGKFAEIDVVQLP